LQLFGWHLDRRLGCNKLAQKNLGVARMRQTGNSSMIRSELVAVIAEANPHLTIRDVEQIVATVFDEITDALAQGRRVELRGFGAFSTRARDARTGRNPRTGDAVKVDAKRVPYFKPGKELRERLNG